VLRMYSSTRRTVNCPAPGIGRVEPEDNKAVGLLAPILQGLGIPESPLRAPGLRSRRRSGLFVPLSAPRKISCPSVLDGPDAQRYSRRMTLILMLILIAAALWAGTRVMNSMHEP